MEDYTVVKYAFWELASEPNHGLKHQFSNESHSKQLTNYL